MNLFDEINQAMDEKYKEDSKKTFEELKNKKLDDFFYEIPTSVQKLESKEHYKANSDSKDEDDNVSVFSWYEPKKEKKEEKRGSTWGSSSSSSSSSQPKSFDEEYAKYLDKLKRQGYQEANEVLKGKRKRKIKKKNWNPQLVEIKGGKFKKMLMQVNESKLLRGMLFTVGGVLLQTVSVGIAGKIQNIKKK